MAWFGAQRPSELVATSITIAEILSGIERLPDGRRKDLLAAAAAEVFSTFDERVLAFDGQAAVQYAQIVGTRERSGRPISGFDAQIAAICHVNGAELATRNTTDFGDTGIVLIDPWVDRD
jgi:toxin FitB